MFAIAWSCLMVLSLVLASGQAFLTASVAGYEHHGKLLASTLVSSSAATTAKTPDTTAASQESTSNEDDEDFDVPRMPPVLPKRRNEEVYVIEFETEADAAGTSGSIVKSSDSHRIRSGKMPDDGTDGQSPLDPWSIVWYIGSFGGLVAFFLIVSCSEWCCRRGARPLSVPYTQRGEVINAQPGTESPPPPYHLFAPPPYDSVNYVEIADKSSTGEKLDIYVITLPIVTPPVDTGSCNLTGTGTGTNNNAGCNDNCNQGSLQRQQPPA